MRPKGYGSNLSPVSDTAQDEYSAARIITREVRIGPIELETARRQLVGIPYRAIASFGFGASFYAASWLPNP